MVKNDRKRGAKEQEIVDLYNTQLRKKKNVTGFSGTLKRKETNGKVKPVKSIRIYVEKKEDLEALSSRDQIPHEIEGIPTDVEIVGRAKALSLDDPKKYYRPAPAGVSAIYDGGTACTLGWFAKDNTDGETVIISNNHCTAKENKLSPGHAYMQPSPYDGTPKKLGELKRFVEIKFDDFTCPYRNLAFNAYKLVNPQGVRYNEVDVGIIQPAAPSSVELKILNIGGVRGKGRAIEGEKMKKMGRTTKLTNHGILRDNDYYGTIGFSRGQTMFGPVGLIQGDTFSAGGDSSSAVVTEVNKFVGLLFAGSDTHTMFCHYDRIEELADVTIIW